MKKILALAMVVAMIAVMAVSTFAADTETGLVGFYKFEGNLKNEVGGEAAPIGKLLAAPAGDAVFADGKLTTSSAIGDGVKLDVTLEKDFTVSFYTKVEGYLFASPQIWMGGSNQSPESWIGVWSTFDGAHGLSIGSNDAAGARVGAEVAVTYPTEEVYVTITVADGVGTLYHNGVEVAKTADGALLPNPGLIRTTALSTSLLTFGTLPLTLHTTTSQFTTALSLLTT